MSDPFEIRKTLMISTGHITADDNDKLNAHSDDTKGPTIPNLICDALPYGFLIRINPENEGFTEELETLKGVLSDDFIACMKVAKSLGVDSLQLDADASEYDFLNIHKW
ncbi:MAG: DUF5983 family protein [Candidatus Hodarchaeales archaeon]